MKKNIKSLQKGSKGHRDFSLRGWIGTIKSVACYDIFYAKNAILAPSKQTGAHS